MAEGRLAQVTFGLKLPGYGNLGSCNRTRARDFTALQPRSFLPNGLNAHGAQGRPPHIIVHLLN